MNPSISYSDLVRVVRTVWTFHFDKDVLLCGRKYMKGRVRLSLVRQRAIAKSDIELYEPGDSPIVEAQEAFPGPYWKPSRLVSERRQKFISRILSDYSSQWSHILRCYLDDDTRHFSSVILQTATMDFVVGNIRLYPPWPQVTAGDRPYVKELEGPIMGI